MIRIRDYKPNSPEWVMAKFFSCWKRRAWMQMLDYVQPSWIAQHEEPNKVLKQSLSRLINAEFIQVNANTGIVAVFLISVHTRTSYFDDQSNKAVRLVREGKKWGVDPNSIV